MTFIQRMALDGNGDLWGTASDASFAYYIFKITGNNVAGATIIPMPATAQALNWLAYGPDGNMWINGARFSVSDSMIFKYDLNSITLAQMRAYTFSVAVWGQNPSAPGFCAGIAVGNNGTIYVTIQKQQNSPQQAYIVGIT